MNNQRQSEKKESLIDEIKVAGSKPFDVFISHASEDKDTIVRELAELLTALGLRVWYDEFTLKIGDSLSQKIDEGLISSSFGIIIISKSFLNKKWTDYEYRSLLSKEDNFKKVVLPIWHNVSYDEVKNFSLYLADKFALDTSKVSLAEIAKKLLEVIRPDIFENLTRMLIYKNMLKTATKETIDISDLKRGDKRRDSLPKSIINRIKSCFYSVGKYWGLNLEKTIDSYLYDMNPVREVEVFEKINSTFLELVNTEGIDDESIKKEISVTLLGISMGVSFENKLLSDELVAKLVQIWKNNFF